MRNRANRAVFRSLELSLLCITWSYLAVSDIMHLIDRDHDRFWALHYTDNMSNLTGRLKREHATLGCMTGIYCAHHHAPDQGTVCESCHSLLEYSAKRLEKCPYGSKKPSCARCPIHCYKKVQRKQVQSIMRFAGPRMVLRHPWRTLEHFFDRFRKVEHPMKMRPRSRSLQTGARPRAKH